MKLAQVLTAHRLKRALIVVSVALLVFAVLGFLAAPRLIQWQLEKALANALDRESRIESVSLNPFTLRLRLEGLRVSAERRAAPGTAGPATGAPGSVPGTPGSASPLFALESVDAHVSWRSLIALAPIVDRLSLVGPRLHFARNARGRYDFEDIVERAQAHSKSQTNQTRDAAAPPAAFSIANIELTNGHVGFRDEPHRQEHRVEALSVRVPFVSSLPVHASIHVEPGLSARVNGAPIELKGRTLPFAPDRASTLEWTLNDLDLPRYLEYLPASLPVKVEAGRLGLDAVLEFAQPVGEPPRVTVRGALTATGADVRERNGRPLLSAEQIRVAGVVARPLQADYALESLVFVKPVVTVQRLASDAGWFASMQTAKPEPANDQAQTGAKPPIAWRVDRIRAESGVVNYLDEQFRPKPLNVQLLNVAVVVDALSSDRTREVTFEASHDTALGEASEVRGRLIQQPLQIEGDARVDRLRLPAWWWIAQPYVTFELTEGLLDSSTHIRVNVVDGRADVVLTDLSSHLTGLTLRQTSDRLEFLRLPELRFSDASFDLGARRIGLGRIESQGARLEVRREADGRFNLAKLVAPTPVAAPAPAAAPAPVAAPAPAAASAPSTAYATKPPTAAAGAPQPWSVALESLAADRYSLNFKDAVAGRAADAALTEVTLRAEQLSNEPGKRGKVSVSSRVNRTGQARVAGSLGLEPVSLRLDVDVRQLGIVPLQPYFAQYVNALVTSGQARAAGELAIDVPRPRAGEAVKPAVAWRGNVGLSEFDLRDPSGQQSLARFADFSASGLQVDTEPLKIHLGDLRLVDSRTRLVLGANGRLNLQDLVVRRAGAAGAADAGDAGGAGKAAGEPPRTAASPALSGAASGARSDPYIDAAASTFAEPAPQRPKGPPAMADARSLLARMGLGRVEIVNGALDFTDEFVQPNFRAQLTGLAGSVSPMKPEQAGDVDLRGRVNQVGEVDISGQINPLTASLFLDLQAQARDIDLPVLTPYSAKYIGYGIEKGKLSARLKYFLQDRRLLAENQIVLDQLTFGEKVESPTAIKAPVLFAVSLLKDRNGVIDINLPIGGTLDDPKFSIGGLIVQVIGNLIVKAVSAPFSLLANLAGGKEEELSKLEFSAGQWRLPESAHERLNTIAKALKDRPALKLDLTGHADPHHDAQALARRSVERQVKGEKLRDTAQAGASAETLDAMQLEGGEFDRLLRRVFEKSTLEKPRDGQGKPRDPTREEMLSMLTSRVTVGEAELDTLASARARAIKDWLQSHGGIDAQRLFVTAPGSRSASGASDGAKPAAASSPRVEFGLK